ncbi:MAG: MucB/RseB C-terminal domain-containing protein [Woeseiaceae bacterium]
MINKSALSSFVTIGVLLCTKSALAADAPDEWLSRMTAALQKASYAGTVIRTRSGDAEALKVVHKIDDGVVNEKVVVQEGSNLEIIRSGDEVHCILPETKSVIVEDWDDQSTIFSTLPTSDISFSNEYDLSLVRVDRVAGRKAMLLAVRPHDEFRFGHRLWLDRATAFPLQTELVAGDGTILEQVKFADINLESSISAEALSPSVSLEDFTWRAARAKRVKLDIETGWVCDDLPPGFRLVSTKSEQLAGAEVSVTHIRYSDGLASVSVFIAQGQKKNKARRSNVGGSNAYSLQHADFQITAVGEVPAITVQRIARSMRQR